jgi:ATP-dependent DNA helicase RecQ
VDAVTAEVAARGGSGIVYVATRRHADQFAQRLRHPSTGSAGSYHGKLRRAERDAVQDAFMRGKLRVVVATNAFGMGINKPDVRFVLHADDPPSVDAYHQEAGRAGRDGEPAAAVLYHRPQDLAVPNFHASGSDPDAKQLQTVLRSALDGPHKRTDLARRAGLPGRALTRLIPLLIGTGTLREDADRRISATGDVDLDAAVARAIQHARQRRELERSRVEMVRRYAETTTCRRRTLLELLGEIRDEPCGHCDNCDAGHGGHRDADDHDLLRPGRSVTHQEFGAGTVQTVDNGDVVVLFEESGYRTLSRAVVTERGLLRPQD